jgi:hypothetical protein
MTGLLKNRQTDEAIIFGRYTIQTMQNVGGNGFPFAAVVGATLPVGCVGPAAKATWAAGFAFVGGGRERALGVHLAHRPDHHKISTRALDDALAAEEDPTLIELEVPGYRDEQRLIVHLPTVTGLSRQGLGDGRRAAVVSGSLRRRQAVPPPSCRPGRQKWYRRRHRKRRDRPASEDVDTHFGEAVEWRSGRA